MSSAVFTRGEAQTMLEDAACQIAKAVEAAKDGRYVEAQAWIDLAKEDLEGDAVGSLAAAERAEVCNGERAVRS